MTFKLLLVLLLCSCATSPGRDHAFAEPAVAGLAGDGNGSGDEESAQSGSQAHYEETPDFGGERSVGGQLKADDEVKTTVFRFDGMQRNLKPYFDWKERLNEEHGLALGADYTAIAFSASEDLGGKDSAGSGNFRLFGSWTLTGRDTANTGSLVFKVEDRYAYGDVPVSGLGFATGYAGLLGPPFNDSGWMTTNLYWMQKFNDGRTTMLAGVVDSTDYMDVYGLINPWTHFSNLVFSTGGGAIPAPNQGLGAAAGTFFGNNMYVVGGIADTNGDPTDLGDSVDTFFNDGEYFTHLELGWTSSYEERYVNNAHVTAWHADQRDGAGVPGGSGFNLSWATFIDEEWLPFARAGFADDGGALLESSMSVGCGRYMHARGDLMALGLNRGEPSADFGSGLPDQYTFEFFYRLQLSQNFALTPDVQYILDPALNPSVSSMWFLGLRARLSL